MQWLMKEYRQAQHSVQQDLLSNLKCNQADTLSSQKKVIHCYLTKIFVSELPSINKNHLYFVNTIREL